MPKVLLDNNTAQELAENCVISWNLPENLSFHNNENNVDGVNQFKDTLSIDVVFENAVQFNFSTSREFFILHDNNNNELKINTISDLHWDSESKLDDAQFQLLDTIADLFPAKLLPTAHFKNELFKLIDTAL